MVSLEQGVCSEKSSSLLSRNHCALAGPLSSSFWMISSGAKCSIVSGVKKSASAVNGNRRKRLTTMPGMRCRARRRIAETYGLIWKISILNLLRSKVRVRGA